MAYFYPWLKQIHVSTVIVSGSLFLTRYIWMLRGSLQQRGRWVRVAPHVNDTILLCSGLAMARVIQQYPLLQDWLSAKFIALLCYIVLGSIALKRGRSRRIRLWAGVLAFACYLYIISSALSRSPIPSPEIIPALFNT